MMMLSPFPLVQRYALISHCENASLLAKADALIGMDSRAQDLLARPGAVVASDIQTRIRDGALRLKQVLWTVQVPTRSNPGLEARTLCLGPEGARWYDLAEDPALTFDGALAEPETRVLRYVPGRRATVIMADGAGPFIRKFKKKERLAAAISRHRMVEEANRKRQISMPMLRSGGPGYCLNVCAGEAMESGLATANRLAALGAVVAQLHACDATGLPMADLPDDPLIWLQAAIPGLDPRLRRIKEALPISEAKPPSLCHGDLSLAQVLVDRSQGEERLTLLDFDRAGSGDAARDLATLLCGLQDARLDRSLRAEDIVIAGYSRIAEVPAGFGPARALAELERLRHLIRKGMAQTRKIVAGLERAEAALFQ